MIVDGSGKDLDSITSFLMIGQSNMAGRGDFGEVEPISNPMCYMLRMGRWQRMSEPINPDGLRFNSLALREFGNRYFDAYPELADRI